MKVVELNHPMFSPCFSQFLQESKPLRSADGQELSKSQMPLGLSKVFPRPSSSPSIRDSATKKETGGSSKKPGSADSGVEFTPVENFASDTEVFIAYYFDI